jgi:pimeloyl-ACP methyl ester carboxylesterase
MINFDSLLRAANADPEFKLCARFWDTRLRIGIDDRAVELVILNGRVLDAGAPGSFGTQLNRITLSASAEVWEKVLAQRPEPGWQDIGWAPGFSVEGNVLDRAPYYAALRRLIALMRAQIHGALPEPTQQDIQPDGDGPVGRYVYITVDGVQYRVYYEQTGSGIPLLMQHTAGTNSLQWRHVLSDPDYQRNFQLIAYDLPFHGKSLPPTGEAWWAEDYLPTREWVIAVIRAISQALGLNRPVFMGCSIGGLLAPVLACDHADEFRAVIGVNAGMSERPEPPEFIDTSERAAGLQPALYFHPRVANDWKGAAMMGLMAPSSPQAFQRETAWLYESEAPRVYYGDIWSYRTQYRLSEERARSIDTSRTAVYLLTGEYDPFALDGCAERLASYIAGSKHAFIPDAGHFAPSDNPMAFKQALDPVLHEVAATLRDNV